MRTLLFIIILIAVVLTGCNGVEGSGNVVTEGRDVAGYDSVSLSGIGEATIIQGEHESLTIEAEDNLMPYITTEVRGDILNIGIKRGYTIRNTEPIKYVIEIREVRQLDVSGAGSMEAELIETEILGIDISGSGDLSIDQLTANALEVLLSGAGSFVVGGEADEQKIDLSGAGEYGAAELMSEVVDVDVSGAGDVTVWATEMLSIDISGAGKVSYLGDPDVTQSVSGVGSVRQIAGR